MKKLLFILICVVSIVLVFAGSTPILENPAKNPPRKACNGYEIIEAGKGIDCYGDTIKLTKRSGFYEVAANTTQNASASF